MAAELPIDLVHDVERVFERGRVAPNDVQHAVRVLRALVERVQGFNFNYAALDARPACDQHVTWMAYSTSVACFNTIASVYGQVSAQLWVMGRIKDDSPRLASFCLQVGRPTVWLSETGLDAAQAWREVIVEIGCLEMLVPSGTMRKDWPNYTGGRVVLA